jgi:hypothetical protein
VSLSHQRIPAGMGSLFWELNRNTQLQRREQQMSLFKELLYKIAQPLMFFVGVLVMVGMVYPKAVFVVFIALVDSCLWVYVGIPFIALLVAVIFESLKGKEKQTISETEKETEELE